jgi:glycine cleavage system aminomethyltransferase T
VMLRDDGIVLDDGATARLDENDYFMTTTTTNAAKILAHLEHLLQTAWADLKVHVTSVSDQYAAFTVAGPSARSLLDVVCMGADLSNEALPNNHFVNATICEVAVRINRMSYSGELAYEVYVASGFSHAVWETFFKAGVSFDIKPYGTESMSALRIEKGHVAGPEIDGRTTLGDLGLAGFASRVKPFSGSVLRHREKLDIAARPRLVGLEFDGNTGGLAGSLIYNQSAQQKGEEQGFLTSTTYSPALKKYIALALLREGRERHGETIEVVNHVGNTIQNAKVVSPHFFDPEGVRQNA